MIGKYKKLKTIKIAEKRLRKQKIKRYTNTIKKYRKDPVLFAEEMLGCKLFEWQKVYLRAIYKMNYKERSINE